MMLKTKPKQQSKTNQIEPFIYSVERYFSIFRAHHAMSTHPVFSREAWPVQHERNRRYHALIRQGRELSQYIPEPIPLLEFINEIEGLDDNKAAGLWPRLKAQLQALLIKPDSPTQAKKGKAELALTLDLAADYFSTCMEKKGCICPELKALNRVKYLFKEQVNGLFLGKPLTKKYIRDAAKLDADFESKAKDTERLKPRPQARM